MEAALFSRFCALLKNEGWLRILRRLEMKEQELHRVTTRSRRIRSGQRLGRSRIGSAGRTVCGYRRHHYHKVLFRLSDNRSADAGRSGTFKATATNLILESKEPLAKLFVGMGEISGSHLRNPL